MAESDAIAPPLLITGCPRSGTSLTAAVFAATGFWEGKTTRNHENAEIKSRVVKPVLEKGGMDRAALTSFADCDASPYWIRRNVVGVLKAQGYSGGPWLFKDVKLVFQWRAWAEAFPGAQWVTVWRPPTAIVESIRERWAMTDRYDFDAEAVVREHHSRAREIARELDLSVPLFPNGLIRGDAKPYQRVAERMGVGWDPAALRAVEPGRFKTGVPA